MSSSMRSPMRCSARSGWATSASISPDTDPRFRGVASVAFLEKIRQHLRSAALVAVHCDVTIMAQQPRLAPFKKQMREFLHDAIAATSISRRAPNEGCGEIGRGRSDRRPRRRVARPRPQASSCTARRRVRPGCSRGGSSLESGRSR
jgi:hypothetical protein